MTISLSPVGVVVPWITLLSVQVKDARFRSRKAIRFVSMDVFQAENGNQSFEIG